MSVTGSGHNGVCLLGEAWGKVEAARALPFQGPAGAKLAHMLGVLGLVRDDFLITNVYWAQPPGNRAPTAAEIDSDRPRWEPIIRDSRIQVVVPMGNFLEHRGLPVLFQSLGRLSPERRRVA